MKLREKAPEEGVSEKEQRLILRRERIIEALQNNQDPSEMKMDVTQEDLLAMKYSPDIIQQAKDYRTSELNYFKELALDYEDRVSSSPLDQRSKVPKKTPSAVQPATAPAPPQLTLSSERAVSPV